jgi:hypothetical protein
LAGVQLAPSAQATQLPFEQTCPIPHAVPSAWMPLSTQTDVPVVHEVMPVLQAVVT